jgi:hypothetical protein
VKEKEFSRPPGTMMRFCAEPDLVTVGGVRLGTTDYTWGETACLSEADLMRYEAADGTPIYGVDVGYSETNNGRVPALGTWTNAVYFDGVQVRTQIQ